MLAQMFKTAAELGIIDRERDALVAVLGMMERGEIVDHQFSMLRWECGTTACIGGWARRMGGKDLLKHLIPFGDRGIDRLCYPILGDYTKIASVAMAAAALRNYLTTGEPYWSEVTKSN